MRLNKFHTAFQKHFKQLKEKHGSGQYSWAEGVNRRAMRNVARKLARKELKERA